MTDLLHTLPNFPTKLYTHLIPSLEKNLITTSDLLTLEPLEIARRAQLPLLDVRRLTRHVLASLQSQLGVVNGSELLREYEDQPNTRHPSPLRQNGPAITNKWSATSTLDPILDAAFHGGIPTGFITEVIGESGAGKTQFLLSLLLTTQLSAPYGLSRPTVYISTEHPLPTPRLTQILHTHPYLSSLQPQQKPSLSRIFSIQTPDLESQDHILTYQIPVLLARHNIGLMVIDSVAANYRAEKNSTSASGAALGLRSAQLMRLGQQLRHLAREHDCAIVVSNQVADRFAPASPLQPQARQIGSSPPQSSPSSRGSSQGMQSLNAAIMPAPPPSVPTLHEQRPSIYPPLTLDHQQNFFTGWSSGPPSTQPDPSHTHNANLKTPALGLVWTNQLSCRIALIKERNMGNSRGGETVAEGTRELRARLWRRYMKVVFCSWGPCTRVDDKGLEFEIWSGGVRGIKME